ncbi:MAG: adenosylmethionine-8-amino-7-oxononanoate aminotransferase apoenzyme [Verrucomicrobiales bacterium]|nr:adenosylmethionine-8-amino-7-oxononanoate aminotransferase apoenzyme [Verrucomicrobiales bacterium]
MSVVTSTTTKGVDYAELDRRFVWHPFTQMKDWIAGEPIVISSGDGVILRDTQGKEYLDGNSSIWTNLHGHNHPEINEAIRAQLGKIAHSSALGLANEPASILGAKLVELAGDSDRLQKVFYSDDGSTAMEVAIKLAYEFARRIKSQRTPRFLSLEGAYHGDTVGAVSVGHVELFHKAYQGLLFATDKVMAPYCYRCPYNRAAPERADARSYRKCNWECVGKVEEKFATAKSEGNPISAMVVEPLMQGAAGMIPQPEGWLRRVSEIVSENGAQLIADEVMTGFGRTGSIFACQKETVTPDFLCVAKGLTGGYLPMAATLTTQEVFNAFLGEYDEFKTFFHGHSYTGNQLGCAAALKSIEILERDEEIKKREALERTLQSELDTLWDLPQVGDIRCVGLIAGIELVRNWNTREMFELRERAGIRLCEHMARNGVLTRPIGSVIVLMPPYCTTTTQVKTMVRTLRNAIEQLPKEGQTPGKSEHQL